MTAPLSRDLRERIARFVEAGNSARAAALRFEVSPSAAIKLMQRVRETGSTAPAKIGGHRRPVLEAHGGTLRSQPNLSRLRPGGPVQDREALLLKQSPCGRGAHGTEEAPGIRMA